MKNVLCVGNHFYPKGGSDRYFINQVDLLEKKGLNPVVFSTEHKLNSGIGSARYFTQPTSTEQLGLYDKINLLHSKRAKTRMSDVIANEKIDIAHLNIYSQFTSTILSPLQRAEIPIIQTLHDFMLICPTYSLFREGALCEECCGGSPWNAVVKKCNRGSFQRSLGSVIEGFYARHQGSLKSIDHFIAVSNFQRNKLLQYNAIPENDISVIPNFVNTDYYPRHSTDGDYLLYFGRIEELKGLKTLVKAMAPLKQIQLLIVGDGRLKDELNRHVETHDLSHIHFMPFQGQNDLTKLIEGSLCTVLPSEGYELCPMSILESFALQRPVIGSNIGGIPELIQHNKNGFLFRPGNVDDLREKIVYAFDNRSVLKSLGERARADVEMKYNANDHYQKLLQVYDRVL